MRSARAVLWIAFLYCSLPAFSGPGDMEATAQVATGPVRMADSVASAAPGVASGPDTSLSFAPTPIDPSDDALLYASPTRKDHIGRIVAPVMVNGKGPFRFIVDTGASYSTISPKLAAALGLQVSDSLSVLVNGITGTAQVPSVMISELRAGDVVFRDQAMPVVWTPVMGGADGFLGIAGLKTERIMVEFTRNRVTISKSFRDRVPPGFQRIHAFRLKGGLMSIDARVGGVRALAIVDTGAQRSLGNLALRDALNRWHSHSDRPEFTDVYGSTTDIVQGELGLAPLISIGPVNIADVELVYGDFHIFDVWKMHDKPTLILGMDVLGSVRSLGIDFRTQELYMEGEYLGVPAYMDAQ